MPTARGSKVSCNILEEATYGVAPASQALQLPVVSVGVRLQRGSNKSRVLRGDRNPTEGFLGRWNVGGPLVVQPDPRSLPFLIKHLLGAVTTTGTNPYTHTIKVGVLPVSLSIEKYFSDLVQVERYLGCRLNQLQFSANDDGLLECTSDVIGASEVDDTVLIDAAPKLYAIQPFALPSLTFQEGGAGLTIGKNFRLTVVNNLDGEVGRVMGNAGKLADLPEGIMGVDFEMDVLFQNLTLLNKAKNETESSISITFPQGANSAKFELKEIKYDVMEPIAEGPNGIVVPMKGYAFYTDDAAASSVIFTGINDVSSIATIPA